MISWINRQEIDLEKYNACIENSEQSLLYAYSWYLDIVCTDWMVMIYEDYDAVMPIPIRKKYFLKYVYPPFWMLQLGIFNQGQKEVENQFITELLDKFRFVELHLNSRNKMVSSNYIETKYFQELNLSSDHEKILSDYQSDRKKDLRKADKFELKTKWDDSPEVLIQLFKNNVGRRTPEIKDNDYQNLLKLIQTCIEKSSGQILSVYQEEALVASAFFLKHKDTVTILCSSTDFENRNNGANTFLIDQAIQKYSQSFSVFNFGGSSMTSVAQYFKSFGASTVSYPMIYKRKVGG